MGFLAALRRGRARARALSATSKVYVSIPCRCCVYASQQVKLSFRVLIKTSFWACDSVGEALKRRRWDDFLDLAIPCVKKRD